MADGRIKYNINTWPANLFFVFKRFLDKNNIHVLFDPTEISYDQIEGLNRILDNTKTSDKEVILAYYKDNMKIDEVIRTLNVSYSHIRFVKNRFLASMAKEPNLSYVTKGYKTTHTEYYLRKRTARPRYIKLIAESTKKSEAEINTLLGKDINETNLTPRVINALRRANIHTVYDLIYTLRENQYIIQTAKQLGTKGVDCAIEWLFNATHITYKNPLKK